MNCTVLERMVSMIVSLFMDVSTRWWSRSRSGVSTLQWPREPNPDCSCFCNEGFTGKQPQLFLSVLSISAFELYQQNWVVVTKVLWPVKPKILTSGSFEKKIASACTRSIILGKLQNGDSVFLFKIILVLYLFPLMSWGSSIRRNFPTQKGRIKAWFPPLLFTSLNKLNLFS